MVVTTVQSKLKADIQSKHKQQSDFFIQFKNTVIDGLSSSSANISSTDMCPIYMSVATCQHIDVHVVNWENVEDA